MNTLGRILIIVTVTFLVAAGLYALVNANASGATTGLIPGGEQFQPGRPLRTVDGQRPEGFRPEGRERGELGGGWIFGVVKNVSVIAILVMVIVLPSSMRKKKRIENQNPEGMK